MKIERFLGCFELVVALLTTRNEARYWSRIAIFPYPTCIQIPVKGLPSEYCYNIWYENGFIYYIDSYSYLHTT